MQANRDKITRGGGGKFSPEKPKKRKVKMGKNKGEKKKKRKKFLKKKF